MKIIFMGTSSFAVPTLRALKQSGFDISLVFTAAPTRSGRGQQLRKSPVHEAADELQLRVITPTTLKTPDVQQLIRDAAPDAIVLASYGFIIPQAVLDIPKLGCFNIHPSLLPRWRGAAPITRAVLAGDTETGVCIMNMDAGLDTGDVLYVRKYPIYTTATSESLTQELAEVGARMLIEVLQHLDQFKPMKQSDVGVTYAHKVVKEEGIIDWSEPADKIERMVRAFTPWPGCAFKYKDEYIRVVEAKANMSDTLGKPGQVLDNMLTISCGQGTLTLLKLQRPGKKVLSAKDFLNGISLPVGIVL
jgi:methionyl-tRNA formyltransferase